MNAGELGIEGLVDEDRNFTGSRFAKVREAIFANPYTRPYERFPSTLAPLFRGLLTLQWQFLAASKRVVRSDADLRWGPDRQGFRRLVHPNGVCLTGLWEITEETPYSGYFRRGSRGLAVARYSTCCTETRRGRTRSLAMVGRIYPTTDPEHPTPLPTASFITQEDIGGADSRTVNEAVLRNAPNTTITRRGFTGAPILFTTGVVLSLTDKQPTIRQVYEIAELGKAAGEPTRAPEFLQLTVVPEQPVIPGDDLDFRDEIMAQVYDTPQRSLTFRIETSDTGQTHGPGFYQRRTITNWREIGRLRFDAAAVSFNGDRVVHFNHPPWRQDRNDPSTAKVRRLSP